MKHKFQTRKIYISTMVQKTFWELKTVRMILCKVSDREAQQ